MEALGQGAILAMARSCSFALDGSPVAPSLFLSGFPLGLSRTVWVRCMWPPHRTSRRRRSIWFGRDVIVEALATLRSVYVLFSSAVLMHSVAWRLLDSSEVLRWAAAAPMALPRASLFVTLLGVLQPRAERRAFLCVISESDFLTLLATTLRVWPPICGANSAVLGSV